MKINCVTDLLSITVHECEQYPMDQIDNIFLKSLGIDSSLTIIFVLQF